VFGRDATSSPIEGVLLGQGNGICVLNIRVDGEHRIVQLTTTSVIIQFI
jgi:hypothetical protein